MSDKKTVEVKKVSIGKTRLFRKREDVIVLTPSDVLSEFEGVPVSITIKAMSHGDAEQRKRLKKALSTSMNIANRKAGITKAMITDYLTDLKKVNSEDKKIDISNLSEKEIEKKSDDELEKLEKFQEKWAHFQDKSDDRDLSGVHKAEDDLLLNAVKCVANNCVSLNFDDETTESITEDSIDEVHPDLFYWILSKIEDESYLTSGEVLGFQ